jgi:hypothetical protein
MNNTPFPHERVLGVFATLLTFGVPLAGGLLASACYPVVVDAVGVKVVSSGRFAALPALPTFVFSHFHGMLWGLFGVTLALALLSLWQWRDADAFRRVAGQLILAVAGALVGVLFLGIFILATASALQAGLGAAP